MKRGEIWMVDFGPPSGPEQSGQRPAVVLQDDVLTDAVSTVLVVPLTTNMKRLLYPATLRLEAGEGGLTQESVVLGFQLQVRGKARFLHKIGELPEKRFAEVLETVLFTLGV